MIDLLFYMSVILLLVSTVLYFLQVIRKSVIPHPFSWIVWALTTSIIAVAQLYSEAGGKAVSVTVFAAFGCALISLFSIRNFWRLPISRVDIAVFFVALAACFLWFYTNSPLYAVVLITAADVLSYYFTIKKVYASPESESSLYFYLAGIKFVPAILIIENFSVETTLFPVAMIFINCAVGVLITYRRFCLNKAFRLA